jgi:hypothetical protein
MECFIRHVCNYRATKGSPYLLASRELRAASPPAFGAALLQIQHPSPRLFWPAHIAERPQMLMHKLIRHGLPCDGTLLAD